MSNIGKNDINKIANMLTDDPDVFNEMACGTGGIAMGPMKTLGSENSGEEFYNDPTTGMSKVRKKKDSKSQGKPSGKVLNDTSPSNPKA